MRNIDSIDWEVDQLVKANLFSDEKAVLRSAMRALYRLRPEIRRQMIVRAYKAAEIMGCSHEEMKEILQELGVSVHLSPASADELLRDADNA
jgi:hypothetical protein